MTKDEYKEKLKQFNSTPKYKSEVDFLLRLMQPKEGEKILDYGCGLGNLVHEIRGRYGADARGYDIINYRENDDDFVFKSSYFFKFDKIYFMHSIAHLPSIGQKLIDLKDLLKVGTKLFIMTPNKDYLDCLSSANYKPDPTVVRHYYLDEWLGVFKEFGFEILNCGQFGDATGTSGDTVVNERLFIEAQWNGR